ncbi:hypothetical protein ACFY2V_28250 [Streptomyces eurythermus]|uniref:hypothetical protein n=1 Tax=Streptomyces eurythermus TaxID=42237 RepID=UPI0036A7BA90
MPPQHDSLPRTGGAAVPAGSPEGFLRAGPGVQGRAATSGVHGGPDRQYEHDLAQSPFPQVTQPASPCRQVLEQYSEHGGLVEFAVSGVLFARRPGGAA